MHNISIYIHWPFCLSKCPYCDFNSHLGLVSDHNIWLNAYLQELQYFTEVIKGKYIKSIFFGGGTPSLMEPFVVAGVINAIAKLGTVDKDTEITLEANPTSFATAKFQNFNSSGINRVSIGVQSLRDDSLKQLGREHSPQQAIAAVKAAANIFSRLSLDLIYARPGQTLKCWQAEITAALKLTEALNHLSLYQLVIEKGTPFYKLKTANKLTLPDQDLAADMYEWTTDYLKSQNYHRYEISNYALRGEECRHNLAYWNYHEYLGIGPGASSRLRHYQTITAERREYLDNQLNTFSIMMLHRPEKWLDSIAAFGHGIQAIKQLTQGEIITEILMMGLRLKEGINIKRLAQIMKVGVFELIDEQQARYYAELKLLKFANDHILLTDLGLMLHSYLVPRLLLR